MSHCKLSLLPVIPPMPERNDASSPLSTIRPSRTSASSIRTWSLSRFLSVEIPSKTKSVKIVASIVMIGI